MNYPSPFKCRYFEAEIMLLCVRWYVRVRQCHGLQYPVSDGKNWEEVLWVKSLPEAERSRGQQHALKCAQRGFGPSVTRERDLTQAR